jgi:hypothetical protein
MRKDEERGEKVGGEWAGLMRQGREKDKNLKRMVTRKGEEQEE